VADDYTVIGRSLFKKETNLQLFLGLKVALSTGEAGVIEGGFGQSGKFKIRVSGEDTGHRRAFNAPFNANTRCRGSVGEGHWKYFIRESSWG